MARRLVCCCVVGLVLAGVVQPARLDDVRRAAAAPTTVVPDLVPGPAFGAFTAPPMQLAVAGDGNVWALEESGRVARVTADQVVTEFSALQGMPGRFGQSRLSRGGDGALFVLGFDPVVTRIGLDGVTSPFPIPDEAGSFGQFLTATPDGDLWVGATDSAPFGGNSAIMTPEGAFTCCFDGDATVVDATVGGDGALYIVSSGSHLGAGPHVLRVKPGEPSTGAYEREGVAVAHGTTAADGTVWVTGYGGTPYQDLLIRITPGPDPEAVEIPLADGAPPLHPAQVTEGSDGAVWFSGDGVLGRYPPHGGQLLLFPVASTISSFATAANDDLWWSAADGLHSMAIGAPVAFVKNDYLDVLGRAATATELTGPVSAFLQPGDFPATGDVTNDLLASREWRDHTVADLYDQLLHRAADPAGLAYFSAQLAAGYAVEGVKSQIIGSDEYFASRAGGDENTYINTVYQDLLQRPADPGGLDYWRGRLDQGTPRWAVARELVYSAEGLRVLVQQTYVLLLDRETDPDGATYWADRLSTGLVSDQRLIALITDSDEYYNKPPPPS